MPSEMPNGSVMHVFVKLNTYNHLYVVVGTFVI